MHYSVYITLLLQCLFFRLDGVLAFVGPLTASSRYGSSLSMALGDYTVKLSKPFGMLLEETESGNGVVVREIFQEGSASSSRIVPGDVLLNVNQEDVSDASFDQVMETLQQQPADQKVALTLGDGLGTMFMPPNVAALLGDDKQDAFLVDAVVRQAVREIRKRDVNDLGTLLKVDVIIGAGVQENKVCKVRFFGFFSTDGGKTSYSCNVSATGVVESNKEEDIRITRLWCAKDEGLGQSIDLINED